jgi:hypothetical protein
MQPIRQIIEDAPATVQIPAELRHRRIELIIWPLDAGEVVEAQPVVWSSTATDDGFTRTAVKIRCRPRVTAHGGATRTAVGGRCAPYRGPLPAPSPPVAHPRRHDAGAVLR